MLYTDFMSTKGGAKADMTASKLSSDRILLRPWMSLKSHAIPAYSPVFGQVLGGVREMPATLWPLDRSSSTTHDPHCPLGPKTATRRLVDMLVKRVICFFDTGTVVISVNPNGFQDAPWSDFLALISYNDIMVNYPTFPDALDPAGYRFPITPAIPRAIPRRSSTT